MWSWQRKPTPAIPAQVAPNIKAPQFGSGLVNPHGLAGNFVIFQGDPGPPDPGVLEAVDHENGENNQGRQ